MRIILQVAGRDGAKAWGVLARHSPGTALPDRTFIVSEEAALALRDAGVRYTVIGKEQGEPTAKELEAGERI